MARLVNRWLIAGTSAFLISAAWAQPGRVFADAPAAAPATQPSADSANPDDVSQSDYCTVLLAPKLRTNLGLSSEQRDKMDDLHTLLQTRLDNCADDTVPRIGPMRQGITPGIIAARARHQLAEIGKQVRNDLTADQQKRLAQLFDDGELQPIEVTGMVDRDVPRFGPNAGKMSEKTGVQLTYTHFGETDASNGNAGQAPPALPPASGLPPTAGLDNPDLPAKPAVPDLPELPHNPAPADSGTASGGGAGLGGAVGDGQAYENWLNNVLPKLSGDDSGDQNKAADALSKAVVYEGARERVLAALEPHINSDANDFRLRCVRAFGHWATAAQVPDLVSVVETPRNPKDMSGAENVWAAAAAAMVNIDPRAAQRAITARTGMFFFRTAMTGELVKLTADVGPGQPAAFVLLKQIDPGNENVQLSVGEAERLLESDSADQRTKGARALAHAVVHSDERQGVLSLLKPHLNGSNGRSRLPFVEAYAHWADLEHVKNLVDAVGYPDQVTGLSGHENCWAAATVGLARLDPQAADDAVKSRSGSFFYRAALHGYLEPVAQGNGPNAATAEWLLDQLEPNSDQPPLPPAAAPAPGPRHTQPVPNGQL